MNELDLYLLFKAETGNYPETERREYVKWLENKIYELTKKV